MNYLDYQANIDYHNRVEQEKKPGQEFCDSYNWKLSQKYNILNRPDKKTWCGGTLYRTITPIKHIWYQSKFDKNHHVWVEFKKKNDDIFYNSSKYYVIVKNKIDFSETYKDFGRIITKPYPDKYENEKIFDDFDDAFKHILNL